LGWRAVRLGYEAFNRRDFDAVLINYHREVQLIPPTALVQAGVVESSYRGHDGYRRYFREWLSAWGAYRGETQELIDLGDRYLTLGWLEGQGGGSRVPVTQEHASLMIMRDGLVIRQQEYWSRAEALEAVGLQE